MGKITTVGIDLAQWPACVIGMEACSGAHEWARRFQALGHPTLSNAE